RRVPRPPRVLLGGARFRRWPQYRLAGAGNGECAVERKGDQMTTHKLTRLAGALLSCSMTLLAQLPPSITERVVPTANSVPISIALGADGALWFTEKNVNHVGRIATSGAITEYPTPTASSSL